MSTTLVLGGVRSGKSRLAEGLAAGSGLDVVYIATAEAHGDAGMGQRIAAHRGQRPAHWPTVEEPLQLAAALRRHAGEGRCLLVDCLTLWLTNLLCADEGGALLRRESEALLQSLPALPGQVVLVSNETGLGVVPMGELTRRFVDEAGVLHQRLAELSTRVLFCVAGLPHVLKGEKNA
jgi:adenosylcobinamide kinase/adenosylcobinamide-phosphate guanylyltransferase